jgi:hypothetical protein
MLSFFSDAPWTFSETRLNSTLPPVIIGNFSKTTNSLLSTQGTANAPQISAFIHVQASGRNTLMSKPGRPALFYKLPRVRLELIDAGRAEKK